MDFHELAMIDTEEKEETIAPQSTQVPVPQPIQSPGVIRVLSEDLFNYDSSIPTRVRMLEEYWSKL